MRQNNSSILKAFLTITLASSLIACSSVETKPFEEFHRAAGNLNVGVSAATQQVNAIAEENLRVDLAEGLLEADLAKYEEVKISTDYDPANPAYFLQTRQFATSVSALTAAYEQYAQMLLMLVAEEAADSAYIDQMQSDIASNTAQAQLIFKSGLSEQSVKATGLIAAGATLALKSFLEDAKRDDLVEALNDNQPVVEDYARLMVEALAITRDQARLEYTESQRQVLNSGLRAMGDSEAKAKVLATELIDIAREYHELRQNLGLLEKSLTKLPQAHRELKRGVESKDPTIDDILLFQKTAIRLNSNYEQSVKDIRKLSAAKELAVYTAKAGEKEAEAATLALLLAQTRANAVEARQAANASPADNDLADRAEALEAKVSELELQQETKQLEAQEYRESVNLIIEKNTAIHGD